MSNLGGVQDNDIVFTNNSTNALIAMTSGYTLNLGVNSTALVGINTDAWYPATTNTIDLGSPSLKWDNLYVNSVNATTLNATTLNPTTLNATGVVSSTLDIAGRGQINTIWYIPASASQNVTSILTNFPIPTGSYSYYLVSVSFCLTLYAGQGIDYTVAQVRVSDSIPTLYNQKNFVCNTQNGQNTSVPASMTFICKVAPTATYIQVYGITNFGAFRVSDINSTATTTVDIIGIC
jgi:hypothetical protein